LNGEETSPDLLWRNYPILKSAIPKVKHKNLLSHFIRATSSLFRMTSRFLSLFQRQLTGRRRLLLSLAVLARLRRWRLQSRGAFLRHQRSQPRRFLWRGDRILRYVRPSVVR